MSSRVMSCPGSSDVPHRKPGDSAISASRSRQQRIADHIVQRAVEIAAPVEQRFGAADRLAQHLLVRRADRLDLRGHLGVGGDRVGEDRDQPVAMAFHLAVAHIEIEPRDELAVAAGGDQQGLADLDHIGKGVMRMAGQDDVDALHARGELAVDVEAVMREQHDELAPSLRTASTCVAQSSSRMPNDQFGIIQRGLAIGV